MDEKGLKYNKRVILLRLILPVLCVCVLLFSAVQVSALGRPFTEFVYESVNIDANTSMVTLKFPLRDTWSSWHNLDTGNHLRSTSGAVGYAWPCDVGTRYTWRAYPLGYFVNENLDMEDALFNLAGIPSGTEFHFAVKCTTYLYEDTPEVSELYRRLYVTYYDSQGASIGGDFVHSSGNKSGIWHFYLPLNIPENADSCRFMFYISGIEVSANARVQFEILDFEASFSLTEIDLNDQIYQNLLKELDKTLGEQGETLQGILDKQQQTNDKLDELPGQIGDQFQDVIDQENEKHESEGNKFVDQLLDILPDPSQDVLAALGSLAGATGYTGTDAVLSIPAIVLPGIGGLFPQTVLWGGDQLDFGEYLEVIPSSLLTLVQSLFTIAIVLFCVFELKGVISYCLTLRSSKGG